MKCKSRVEVRRLVDANRPSKMVEPPLFCIVSWHYEGRDLSFWDGSDWGAGQQPSFFKTRKEAAAAIRKMKYQTADGFLKPNVLDVSAYNKRFGKSLGPRPEIRVTAKLDRKTGILERVETHE